MRRFRVWIFGTLLVLLFCEIWLGFPIKLENAEVEAPKSLAPSANEAQQKMKGVHLVETRSGDRDWELFADAAEGYEGKAKWQLQHVKIQFYSKSQQQFVVTGDIAEIDTKTRDMKIEGNVKTVSENGYRFESPLLLYMSKLRILESPGPILMEGPSDPQGPGMKVRAKNMYGYIENSEMRLEGDVVAEKKFKNGHRFQVRAQKAQFSGKNYQANFREQVVMEYNSMKLEGPEASFQYKSKVSLLESVQLKGGVRISDVDKYATSDLVRIEPETNRLILSGKPRVVQDQDEIFGDRIVFIDGGKKVKVEKMRARVEKSPGEQ